MKNFTRRDFFKLAGSAALGMAAYNFTGFPKSFAQSPVIGSQQITNPVSGTSYAKVYFTKHIDADHLIKLYSMVNEGIYGKVAIKLHTGEKNGPNILPRDMVRAFQSSIPNSNIVETNTYYKGDRDTTEKHRETLKVNGWTFCPVDIMDEDGAVMLPVRGGRHFKEMSVGKNMLNYDSMVVLTHFKGHTSGGFGGSLKNIAIGCADAKVGKKMQHGDGFTIKKAQFQENMTESAKATIDYFGKHIVFLNVMRRMSVDCDCAGVGAAEPTIPDIGMVASTDLLAVDQACVDLVYARPENERHDLVERIETREGLRQLSYMKELKMGNDKYRLISID